MDVKQPVYIRDNVYWAERSRSKPRRARSCSTDDDVTVRVVDEGRQVHLETQLPDAFNNAATGVITGADLQPVRFVDADFEDPDGAPATLDTDLLGERKNRWPDLPRRTDHSPSVRLTSHSDLVT